MLVLSLQAMRGGMQRKQELGGRVLNAEYRGEILISSWYSLILTTQWHRDNYCTHFIDGTKVQKSQNFAKSHTSECSRTGMLEVQESHQNTPLMAQSLCWQPTTPGNLPPPTPRPLQPLTHHPYLWTLQGGRSNMEKSKIQAWNQNTRFRCHTSTS